MKTFLTAQWKNLIMANYEVSPAILEKYLPYKAEFITEHYWGYTKLKNSSTSQYQVEHPRWQVYPIKSYEVKCDFKALYGSEFECLNLKAPISVLMAQGSEIKVRQGKQID